MRGRRRRRWCWREGAVADLVSMELDRVMSASPGGRAEGSAESAAAPLASACKRRPGGARVCFGEVQLRQVPLRNTLDQTKLVSMWCDGGPAWNQLEPSAECHARTDLARHHSPVPPS